MKTRLFKNWITSIAGILILLFAGYLTFKGVITFEAFIAALPTCFLLFRAKDSLLWAKGKDI